MKNTVLAICFLGATSALATEVEVLRDSLVLIYSKINEQINLRKAEDLFGQLETDYIEIKQREVYKTELPLQVKTFNEALTLLLEAWRTVQVQPEVGDQETLDIIVFIAEKIESISEELKTLRSACILYACPKEGAVIDDNLTTLLCTFGHPNSFKSIADILAPFRARLTGISESGSEWDKIEQHLQKIRTNNQQWVVPIN